MYIGYVTQYTPTCNTRKRTGMNHPLPRNENSENGRLSACATRTGQRFARAITVALAFLLATVFLPAFADEAQDEFDLGVQAFGTKQYEAAVEHYRRAAELGHSGGQNTLGYCYYYGMGVERDYEKAVEWYRKSAEQGNGKAQHNMGVCYSSGNGVIKDQVKAVEWYRKSAEQGWANAQFSLGMCYASGNGVEADEAEAERWLRLAAEQGHPDAQHYFKYRWFRRFKEQHNVIFEFSLKVVILAWFFLINVCILSFVAKVAIFFGKKRGVVRCKPFRRDLSGNEAGPPPAKNWKWGTRKTEKIDEMKQMRLTYTKWLKLFEKNPKRYYRNLLGMFLFNRVLVFLFGLGFMGILFLAACNGVFGLLAAYRITMIHLLLAAIQTAPFFLLIVPVFRRRKPVGMPLDPQGYARLYDAVGELCRELGTAPIRQIRLDMSFRVTVLSRFQKIACIRRDILVVGYPLLCALDAESFRICLARALSHERSRLTRGTLLKRIEFLCGFPPPESYHPGAGTLDMMPGDALTICGAILPLQIQVERRCDAFCRERFGGEAFDAFVTQAGVRGRQWNLPDFVLNKIGGDLAFFEGHPAAVIRDEVRKTIPEAETKKMLEGLFRAPGVAEMLDPEAEHPEDAEAKEQAAKFFRYPPRNMSRSPEIWLKMTLPPFRERIGTDDPAELLPYLERTPDALEHYLAPGADFEAEFNRTLKESFSWELFQIFGFVGYAFDAPSPQAGKPELESEISRT